MNPEGSKALIRRFVEALNSGNMDLFDEIFTTDYILHDPGTPGGILRGLEDVKKHTMMLYTGLPDFHSSIQELIAEGDRVVGRFVHHGTHTAEMMGIPPSGRQVAVEAINIYRIADDKLAEGWGEVDTIGLLQQLGAIPAPGQSAGQVR